MRSDPRNRLADGQGLVEAAMFSFLALLLAAAACEGGKWCLAQACAESAATAVVRTVSADLNGMPSDEEVLAAARSAASPFEVESATVEASAAETETYDHKLEADGSYVDRRSTVSSTPCTVTVKLKADYITSLGKVLAIGTGSDGTAYEVTSVHAFSKDSTLEGSW